MKSLIHYIQVSAYCKPGDRERTRSLLTKLLPEGVDVSEASISPEDEGGLFTSELFELGARLEKSSQFRDFKSLVLDRLDDYDIGLLSDSVERYVDDECNLYIRLSKTELEVGNIVLEARDCVHVRVKLKAFPAKKENAIKSALDLLRR